MKSSTTVIESLAEVVEYLADRESEYTRQFHVDCDRGDYDAALNAAGYIAGFSAVRTAVQSALRAIR